MYFPILRGRQNELLAIRELAQAGKLDHVVPVIEPVKASSTLLTTLRVASEEGIGLAVIVNPAVGTLASDLANDPDYVARYESALDNCEGMIFAYRTGEGAASASAMRQGRIAYFLERGFEAQYDKLCEVREPDFTFLEARDLRRKRRATGEAISLDHQYKPQQRNADYQQHDDDFLTEEHLFFRDDGYFGFSDYSIIGEDYNEGGFMPQVVALHLTYLDEKEEVHIRHFTSRDDFGETDVAGKFSDALEQMIDWASDRVPMTSGLAEYIEVHNSGRFPGLGVAKKLSLKHHMEMMNDYLERHQ